MTVCEQTKKNGKNRTQIFRKDDTVSGQKLEKWEQMISNDDTVCGQTLEKRETSYFEKWHSLWKKRGKQKNVWRVNGV